MRSQCSDPAVYKTLFLLVYQFWHCNDPLFPLEVDITARGFSRWDPVDQGMTNTVFCKSEMQGEEITPIPVHKV